MTNKKAIVFVSDPHITPPTKLKAWEEKEVNKANNFMAALINNWGMDESDIITVGHPSRMLFGTPNLECNTRAPADPPPGARDLGRDLDLAFETWDRKINDDADPDSIIEYILWIADNCPCSPAKMKIKQKTPIGPPEIPHENDVEMIKEHLQAIRDNFNNPEVTVIFSGEGSGVLASLAQNPGEWTTIASHDGYHPVNPEIDKFDIGIVMPQIPPFQWDEAFLAELARLNGEQTPFMWPGP